MFEIAVQTVLEALKTRGNLGRICRASRASLRSLVEGQFSDDRESSGRVGNASEPDQTAEVSLAKRAEVPPPENLSAGMESFVKSPGLDHDVRLLELEQLEARVAACQECSELVCSRSRPVRGQGSAEASVLFFEEAPSPEQDRGENIAVGEAAELFEKILKAMGLNRNQVFVAHAVRCLPPCLPGDDRNRRPLPEEVDACRAHLRELVRLIRPRVIVAMGSVAARGVLGTQEPVARLRSQWREWGGIPVMVTFHPGYLIENKDLANKRKVWEDLLQVMEKLDMPISAKQRGFFLK